MRILLINSRRFPLSEFKNIDLQNVIPSCTEAAHFIGRGLYWPRPRTLLAADFCSSFFFECLKKVRLMRYFQRSDVVLLRLTTTFCILHLLLLVLNF